MNCDVQNAQRESKRKKTLKNRASGLFNTGQKIVLIVAYTN